VEEALTQIEARELSKHLEKALVRRLVESVELLDFLDAFCIDALSPPVAGARGRGRALARAAFASLKLRDHLLDRTARYELGHDERDQDDPEEGRDHQEYALQNVGPHKNLLPLLRRCSYQHVAPGRNDTKSYFFIHHVEITQSSGR
jgi:hypothetical protein